MRSCAAVAALLRLVRPKLPTPLRALLLQEKKEMEMARPKGDDESVVGGAELAKTAKAGTAEYPGPFKSVQFMEKHREKRRAPRVVS